MYKFKLLIAVLTGLSILSIAKGKIVNCVIDPYRTLKDEGYLLKPSDIDPALCTHLKYPVDALIRSSGEVDVVQFDKVFAGLYISGFEYKKYLAMAKKREKRKSFIKTVLNFLTVHGFDGFDIGWLIPNHSTSTPREKKKFYEVLKELKAEFKRKELELSISLDLSAERNRIPFDITCIVKEVDFINVLAFGYAAFEYEKLVYDAPLVSPSGGNVMLTINYWLKQCVPAEKLVLGIPFYGNLYSLRVSEKYLVNGPAIRKSNGMSYNKICSYEKQWLNEWDKNYNTSLLLSGYEIISYDNAETIKNKVEFGNCLGLAGFMVSNLENDDFNGDCDEKYPLLKAINNKLHATSPELSCEKFKLSSLTNNAASLCDIISKEP